MERNKNGEVSHLCGLKTGDCPKPDDFCSHMLFYLHFLYPFTRRKDA